MEVLLRDRLYWHLKKFSLRHEYFAYFDVPRYLADPLFVKREVTVWYDEELGRPDKPYVMIVCHVRKKDAQKFMKALEELKKSMVICGHLDYEETVSEMMNQLDAAAMAEGA